MEDLSLIIIDDEVNARQLLSDIISEIPGIKVLASCSNVDIAFDEIIKNQPDAILLDIQMPKKDGFVLIEMLQNVEIIPEIIFVTAYDKFAIKGIKSAAFDYLLKPVKKDELKACLNRLNKKRFQLQQKIRIEQLLHNINAKEKIRINDRTGYYIFDSEEILYIKANGNYSELIINDRKTEMVTLNLGKLESMIKSKNFVRISRSCIININFLIKVDKKNMICVLKNKEFHECHCSKQYLKELEKMF